MFDNIGGKMKGIAVFFCIVGIVVSVIGGLCAFGESFGLAIGIGLGGSVASYLGSMMTYTDFQ